MKPKEDSIPEPPEGPENVETTLKDIVDKVLDSPDKKLRRSGDDWIGVLIHHTGVGGRKEISDAKWKQLLGGISNWLSTKDDYYLSAHFMVGRAGELYQMVDPDTHVAYHAGKSEFWNPEKRIWQKSMNYHMIGIEILGDGNMHLYSDEQYQVAAELVNILMKRYPTINPQCIVGHEVVSPGRKSDPGKFFDWQRFYDEIWTRRLIN